VKSKVAKVKFPGEIGFVKFGIAVGLGGVSAILPARLAGT
jgi:hypothetical protein